MHVIQLVWVTMALYDLQTGASSYCHIPHRMDTCKYEPASLVVRCYQQQKHELSVLLVNT